MKIKMTLLLLSMFVVGLAACGADPRNAADAYATTTQANTDKANADQQRQITADEHAQAMAEAQAVQAEQVAAKQRAIKYGSIAGVIALVIVMGASAWFYVKYVAPGLAQAAVTAADIKSRCIPLDRKTMTFPALVNYLPDGRVSLTLPDLSSVMLLDQPHEPNAQQIATQGQTKVIGLMTQAAAHSRQDGTLAMLQAPVINAMEVEDHPGKGVKVYRAKKEGTS
jgi:hypothetical protein